MSGDAEATRRSALGQVRGYGSAKEGVAHWWTQRLTSVALIVLGCWFVVSLLALPAFDYVTLVRWMRSGWTALPLILFAAVATWHSELGVRVIIEDYVHEVGAKTVALAFSTFIHVVIGAASVLAVLKVALGGPP
ncbi:MAG TPA: succinate dehydrogenase, hydrophobic membrane anchor protein [Steroidobacteraceae bacterium]|nr:succinate dehydrogenase, hydrophobic membrane anchor protein [Steroidobacteraceae bacterium]